MNTRLASLAFVFCVAFLACGDDVAVGEDAWLIRDDAGAGVELPEVLAGDECVTTHDCDPDLACRDGYCVEVPCFEMPSDGASGDVESCPDVQRETCAPAGTSAFVCQPPWAYPAGTVPEQQGWLRREDGYAIPQDRDRLCELREDVHLVCTQKDRQAHPPWGHMWIGGRPYCLYPNGWHDALMRWVDCPTSPGRWWGASE